MTAKVQDQISVIRTLGAASAIHALLVNAVTSVTQDFLTTLSAELVDVRHMAL